MTSTLHILIVEENAQQSEILKKDPKTRGHHPSVQEMDPLHE